MESSYEGHGHGVRRSLNQAWHHCKHMFSAASAAEAWQAAKRTIDALPMWALVVLLILAASLVIDRSLLLVPLAAIAFLLATYHTVKRAVADALKERDSL